MSDRFKYHIKISFVFINFFLSSNSSASCMGSSAWLREQTSLDLEQELKGVSEIKHIKERNGIKL